MVTESLKSVLQRGFGVGELAGDQVSTGFAEHPICGDQVELSVQQDGGLVRAVRWRASGCPASMAVAALAAQVMVDIAIDDIDKVLSQAIRSHGGLARHERHAEAMVLRALRDALRV